MFNLPIVLDLVFRFYSRALTFPYDQMAFELQHIFRETEVLCQDEWDESLANKILDIINFFQGEEISELQGEYTRLFVHSKTETSNVSFNISDYCSYYVYNQLLDEIYESGLGHSFDDIPDDISTFFDYGSFLMAEDNFNPKKEIFHDILRQFSQQLHRQTTKNFYKEIARGITDICFILKQTNGH